MHYRSNNLSEESKNTAIRWRVALAALCVAILMLVSVTICGCLGSGNSEDLSYSTDADFSVTDLTGRTAYFNKPAERVVALAASDVETLYALGAGDKIVARGTYCDYPEEAKAIKDVGSGELTSIEAIIALKPDVVFMSKMGQTTAQVSALENAGLRVIVNEAPTIQKTYDYIRVLGKVVDKTAEANSIVKHMEDTFSSVTVRMAKHFQDLAEAQGSGGKEISSADTAASAETGDNSQRIYFEVSPLQYGLWTAGNNTYMQEIAEILCMKNVFSDVDGWSEISEEQVIARNPGTIIAVTMYNGEGQRPEDEICSRPGWDKIDAVQKRRVYNIDSNTITRPGPRLADAANEICNKVTGG